MKELIQQIIIDKQKTNLYISNLGNIYRQKNNGDMFELTVPHRMYYNLPTYVNGKRIHLSIHRLVAEYFVPGRTEERNVVHHVDGNPLNNFYKNLQWVTQDYNVKVQNVGFDRNKKKTNLYKNGILINTFDTQTEAAEFVAELGFSKSSIIRYKKSGDYSID